jgi:hypothetical protein
MSLMDWAATERDPATEFEWDRAPRMSMVAPRSDQYTSLRSHEYPRQMNYLVSDVHRSDRLKDYFLLPGLLFRWIKWYQKLPRADSWVWKYYPEGDFWLKQALNYDVDRLQKALLKSRFLGDAVEDGSPSFST